MFRCFRDGFIRLTELYGTAAHTPKFSFHSTQYAQYRPNVLGSSFVEQILKGLQWANLLAVGQHIPFQGSKIPKWLNLAIGYGADDYWK
jgi:hypothetical protein